MWQWLWINLFGRENLIGEAPRSSSWDKVRNAFLDGKECRACGKLSDLEAHHVLPFHLAPELELDPGNLVALCRRCHLVFGHLGCWQCVNPEVLADSDAYRQRLERNRGVHHGKS